MPNLLEDLTIREVSLVDHPANSSVDEKTGRKVPRARIALWKRDDTVGKGDDPTNLETITKEQEDLYQDAIKGRTQGGVEFPKSDYAYTPDDVPSHWKLRLTRTPGGRPDPGIVGAATAALGKGFRGNKVIIPSADLPSVKAKVRAAWKKANPDKGGEELPAVLKGATNNMTLAELETAVTKQDGVIATMVAENNVLKQERELVLKMSKKQRKAYASMSAEQQKAFMAGDETKRKAMCDTAMKTMKEKKLEDCMEEAVKAEYAAAGPGERLILLAKQEQINKAASDAEGGSNEDEMKRKAKSAKAKSHSDDEDDEEDDDDDEVPELKRKLAKAEDDIAKTSSKLTAIEKREKVEHFTKRAELELPNTAGSPVEKGTRLMTIADATGGEDSDVFKAYLADLKAADKALTIHFGEVGKAGGAIPAEKALDAKADEIAKRDKIDKGHAMAKALEEAPELYIAYETQKRHAIHSA